jgi:DNA-directed RNA polymerase II subunit RPB1
MDAELQLYDDKIRQIDSIDFSILGNDEIKRMSVFDQKSKGIDMPDLYDNMEPKRGGLIDTRLGTSNKYIDCSTCGLNSTYCVGHFGHIDLEEPVFHMGYIDFVKKILSVICLKCSKLLVYKNEKELKDMMKNKSGKQRFNDIRNIVKNVTYCQKQNYGCGTPVSKIKKEVKKLTGIIRIISETIITTANVPNTGDAVKQINAGPRDEKKKIRRVLTAEICYNILKNISDTDCKIIGLDPLKSRPEMMIHLTFPVPPVQMRPSIKAEYMASSTMEDDLTLKLADIIKANIRLRKFKEKEVDLSRMHYTTDYTHLLQYHVGTFYDNETLSVPKSEQKGKAVSSLSSRLKGKHGRVRGNLMGKRVDFSARTVITPDPTLDINELGVPMKIAQNLTFPEIVTPYNIDKLSKLVKNGREIYPGANYVFPASKLRSSKRVLSVDLRYAKESVELRYGDVVERHIQNGDMVLLNRQPTLHKLSMMGHKVKVVLNPDLSTFRLNLAVTGPYNADFDGEPCNADFK